MQLNTSFIDSRMAPALGTNHFPSLCTIQAATEAVTARQEIIKTWANVTSLIGIACSVTLSSGRKVKGKGTEYGLTTHRISLAGTYTTITRLNRAVVDGVTYGIEYVSPPGFDNSITVLECTVVN
jgi:head-tail adaptor